MFQVELFNPENLNSMFPHESHIPAGDYNVTSRKKNFENNLTCLFVS
jgi:hypothetical protein